MTPPYILESLYACHVPKTSTVLLCQPKLLSTPEKGTGLVTWPCCHWGRWSRCGCHWMISQAQAHKTEVTTQTDVKGQRYQLWSLNTFIFTLLIIQILQRLLSESLRGDWQDRDTEGNHFSTTWNPTPAHREEQQQGERDFWKVRWHTQTVISLSSFFLPSCLHFP